MTLRERIGLVFIVMAGLLVATTPALASPNDASYAPPSPEKSAPVKLGGLTCFSIAPPTWYPPSQPDQWPTCDKLCAAQEAVCTGMQNGGVSPPMTCSDPISSPFMGVCRCCKVAP